MVSADSIRPIAQVGPYSIRLAVHGREGRIVERGRMVKTFSLGKLMGTEIRVAFSALVGFILLVALGSGVSLLLFTRDAGFALLAGLGLAGIHFTSAGVHQLSHALAARSTGYPMNAVRFGRWLILATSIYPDDEPDLDPGLHIRRAIGGPIGSLVFSALCLAAALALRAGSTGLAAAVALAGVDSLFIFTLGSLVPLGFTDMSTILHYSLLKKERS